jgi:uncharacterized protein
MTNKHGDFIWYELMTSNADAAANFYGKVVGWAINDSGMQGMDYRMLHIGDHDIGGMMAITPDMVAGGTTPSWIGYVGVDDVDKMVASVTDGGGAVHMGAQDIPGVGRMAMVADPEGATFYVMRGTSDETSLSFAADMPRVGHCAWNELATTDQPGAHHFYGQRFGWVKDGEMDMGELGKYDFLRHGEGMIGAIMPTMPHSPASTWTYYFRVADIDAAVSTIEANGGTITQPPIEIPGGDFSMCAIDPQGASFGLVGSRKG